MKEQIKKKPCGFEAARLDKQVIGHNALTDRDIITEKKEIMQELLFKLKKNSKIYFNRRLVCIGLRRTDLLGLDGLILLIWKGNKKLNE